jgi:hypothetical protein
VIELFKRVLFGNGGPGSLVGTLLQLFVGLAFVLISAPDLAVMLQPGPTPLRCQRFVEDPSQARWVSLTGCRLELPSAASRRFAGLNPFAGDAGTGARYLELFVPLTPVEDTTGLPVKPTVVLATSDPALLKVMDTLARLPEDEAAAFVQAHATELRSLVEPETLTGFVRPLKSRAAQSALEVLGAEAAVVVEQNREPVRRNAIFGIVAGLLLMAWALYPLVRRWQLEFGGD